MSCAVAAARKTVGGAWLGGGWWRRTCEAGDEVLFDLKGVLRVPVSWR